jgi:hypothetical protein
MLYCQRVTDLLRLCATSRVQTTMFQMQVLLDESTNGQDVISNNIPPDTYRRNSLRNHRDERHGY